MRWNRVTNMFLLIKSLKTWGLAIYGSKKLLSDTVLILKVRKSRSERELLNLNKLFRKPSINLVGGFCESID